VPLRVAVPRGAVLNGSEKFSNFWSVFAMHRCLLWTIVGIPLALVTATAGTAVALPAARNVVLGLVGRP